MARDRDGNPGSPPAQGADDGLPLGLWLIWTVTVVGAGLAVAWPALRGEQPLDLVRLVITCALVGVAGLVVLTTIEIRMAPWRFLD